MLTPARRAFLDRWREVLIAGGVALFGIWVATRGGWFLGLIGLAIAAVAAVLGVTAWRRLRFARAAEAPGLVEIDEAQIGYMGPMGGGFVALTELVEIRLIYPAGRAHWRLKQADGQALLVPVAASGAEALFDCFAALPGIEMRRLIAALDAPAADTALRPPLWRRPGQAGRAQTRG